MPCYSTPRSQIDLLKAEVPILKEALEALGLRVTMQGKNLVYSGSYNGLSYSGSYAAGKLTQNGYNQMALDTVKEHYSHAGIKHYAAKKGYTLKKTSADSYAMIRR